MALLVLILLNMETNVQIITNITNALNKINLGGMYYFWVLEGLASSLMFCCDKSLLFNFL